MGWIVAAVVSAAFLVGLTAAGPMDERHPALRAIAALGSAQMAAHAGLRGDVDSRAYVVFLDDPAAAEAALSALIGTAGGPVSGSAGGQEDRPGGIRRDTQWPFAGSWLVHVAASDGAAVDRLRAAPGVRLVLPRPMMSLCV